MGLFVLKNLLETEQQGKRGRQTARKVPLKISAQKNSPEILIATLWPRCRCSLPRHESILPGLTCSLEVLDLLRQDCCTYYDSFSNQISAISTPIAGVSTIEMNIS